VLELPEVEVLRRDLEREVVGRKVKSVEIKSMAALARYKNRKAFTSLLEGVKFSAVARKGLRLLITLDNEQTLAISVGNGSLRKISGKEKNLPVAEMTITFVQGGSLIYVMNGPGADFVVVGVERSGAEAGDVAVVAVAIPLIHKLVQCQRARLVPQPLFRLGGPQTSLADEFGVRVAIACKMVLEDARGVGVALRFIRQPTEIIGRFWRVRALREQSEQLAITRGRFASPVLLVQLGSEGVQSFNRPAAPGILT